MKLPEKKEKQLGKQGRRSPPPVEGGGAAGRARQFQRERGLDKSGAGSSTAAESSEEKDERDADGGLGVSVPERTSKRV